MIKNNGKVKQFCCFSGGNLYRKERKKRVVKPEPKPVVIEPATISIDDRSMVEDENVPVPIDTILLPKRRLPDLEFPDNLKYHTGYNCYLVHEKNTVRNSNIKTYKPVFFFLHCSFIIIQLI